MSRHGFSFGVSEVALPDERQRLAGSRAVITRLSSAFPPSRDSVLAPRIQEGACYVPQKV